MCSLYCTLQDNPIRVSVPRFEKAFLEPGLLVVPKLDLTVQGCQLDSLLPGHWVSALDHGLVTLEWPAGRGRESKETQHLDQ